MTDTPTAELARFVANLEYSELPEPIRERVKDIILDTLASALAGRQGDETKQIRALAGALGASRETSVIGGEQLSLAGATLLNGYLITAVTVCDVHRPTLCHTTPQVVPPALAIAERDSASGKALILAVAHRRFLDLPASAYVQKIVRHGCLIDVKSAFDPVPFCKEGLRVWRL